MKRGTILVQSLLLTIFLLLVTTAFSKGNHETLQQFQLGHTAVHMTLETNILPHLLTMATTQQKTATRGLFLVQLTDEKYMVNMESLLGQKPLHILSPTLFALYVENTGTWARNNLLPVPGRQLRRMIQWMGHLKPEYKTSLNFDLVMRLGSNDMHFNEQKENRIQLFAILATYSSNQNQKLMNRMTRRTQMLTNYMKEKHPSLDASVEITQSSPQKLKVIASPSVSAEVLNMLKEQKEIVWIERHLPLQKHNHFANIIIQSNGTVSDQDIANELKPIWSRGITGEGEIVGVGDTGLDYDNCFFNDPNMPSIVFNTVMDNHRKLVAYNTIVAGGIESDHFDEPSGHGTHVCGSVAGQIIDSCSENDTHIEKFAGVAKDAKLHFTDIENSSLPDILLIPDDLFSSDYFRRPYAEGVRIHSNSWGCAYDSVLTCSFDCQCTWTTTIPQFGIFEGQVARDSLCFILFGTRCCQVCAVYDSQASEVDAFLYVNQDMLIVYAAGNYGSTSSQTSIATPSTSKNALSVGASMTLNEGFIEQINYVDLEFYFQLLSPFGISNIDECCAFPSTNIRLLCCPDFMRQRYAQKNLYNQHNMASFSSRGPTLDGRFKPDLVAPGSKIISTHSDGNPNSFQCSDTRPALGNEAALLSNQGTSMSTPIVAGAAALVRQFYRTSGFDNPSGYLVKATLIHSAQNMNGNVVLDNISLTRALPNSPNIYNGFGLVSLSSVILDPDDSLKLFAFDRQSLTLCTGTACSDTQHYCFTSTDANPEFKVTLTWYDPPGVVGSSQSTPLLVNNLDLIVSVASSTGTVSRFFGNNRSAGDAVNNVEVTKVTNVINAANFTIDVAVKAKRLSFLYPTQTFAVVVTGQVQNVDCAP